MPSPASELTSLVVRAGAGAGKTTRLVQQVLDVATHHFEATGGYPNLMLTTFTRKATQELRERLMLKAVELGDEGLLEYLSGPQLHVSTIHGVLSVFLKRFGHLAGLDNAFQMVSPAITSRLAKSILRKLVLQSDEASELVSLLGFHRLCSILVRLSRERFERAELEPANEERMLNVWQSIWRDQQETSAPVLRSVLNETSDEKYIDYVNIVLQVLEDFAKVEKPSEEVLERGLARIPSKPRFNAKNPQIGKDLDLQLKAVVDGVKKLASQAEMNPRFWADLSSHFAKLHSLSSEFQTLWTEAKLEKAVLDSDDLESMTLHILKSTPELGEAFAAETDYWLIDEYQDTSPLQVKVLQSLSQGKSQFVVGDPQQSIYLFRGSDVSVFRDQEVRMA
ncbi:MAG: UvrD-helicase domain-containing protein, partial [Pseudomonadota bacterium]